MDASGFVAKKGFGAVFGVLLEFPRRRFSINGLAREAKVPYATCWLLVSSLERAGVVDVDLIGRTRAVSFRENEFSKRLAELVGMSVSPQRLSLDFLKKRLGGAKGGVSAFLFGSVAAGREKLGSDVDVAVLGRRGLDLHELAFEVLEKFGARVAFVYFANKKEFDEFLSGKKTVKLA